MHSQNTVPGRIQAPNTILFLLNSWFLYCSSAVKGISSAVRRFTLTICMYRVFVTSRHQNQLAPKLKSAQNSMGTANKRNQLNRHQLGDTLGTAKTEISSNQLRTKSAQKQHVDSRQAKSAQPTPARDSPHQPPPKDTLG